MNLKKGVTMSVMLIAVALMSVLAGTAIIYGTSSINLANKGKFESIVDIVKENTELYYEREGTYPICMEGQREIQVTTSSLDKDLKNELVENGDTNEFLNVLDLKKLKIPSIELGNIQSNLDNNISIDDQIRKKDVFLINQETGNIYYMAGLKFKGKRIHSNTK